MTKKEKEENPSYKTTGGYLKVYNYKEAWKIAYDKATDEDIELLKALPNFDADVFKFIPYGEIERRGRTGEKIKERSIELNPDTGEYEFNELSLAPGESLRLSPIDNFLNVLSSLGAETAYRTLIRGPREYMTALHDKGRLGEAGLGYLEYLLRGQRSIDSRGSRQFLRDITSTTTNPLEVSWPSLDFSVA
mgnify:CR=1 FL=1